MPEHLELAIVQFLKHTGPLACNSKGGLEIAARKDTCYTSQQFHHPKDTYLIRYKDIQGNFEYLQDNRDKLYEEFDEDLLGLTALQFTTKMSERKMVWKCCGSHFLSTGCISNNDREMIENVDTSNEEYGPRDWDGSYGGGYSEALQLWLL